MVKKTILKKFADIGTDLTLAQMRSYGTKTKVSPNQVKIGSTESGLYYDKDLPFIQKIPTVSASGKRKGKKGFKYRLRAEQSPDDLILSLIHI